MFNKTDPSIFEGEWNFEKTERAIMGLTKILNRYAHKLTLEDLRNATHGLLFLRQMNVDEFIRVTDEMKHNI